MVIAEIKKELKKIDSSHPKLREFGFQMGAFMTVVGVLLRLLGRPHYTYLLYPGITFIALGALLPVTLYPIQRIWMPFAITFSALMGKVMTPVFLSLLFYIAITPIGIIMRLMGKDILDRKLDPKAPTYWKIRPRVAYTPEDYEKQF